MVEKLGGSAAANKWGNMGMFKPVKKTRVYDEICARIIEMLEKGDLNAGDRLPSERELSVAFRVSRPSVREALKTLESHGCLDTRHGDGTYISRDPLAQKLNPHAAANLTLKTYQIQILEMRRLVEPQIASLAAERATKDEISSMERTLNLQQEKVRIGETGADIDKIFHYIIAVAAKNKLLMHVIDTATDLFAENRNRYMQFAERPERSIRHHSQILGAISVGDSALAAKVMNDHLDEIHETLFAVPDPV